MNLYMARAIAGGMIANREKVQYPKNPFLPIEEQASRDKIKTFPIYQIVICFLQKHYLINWKSFIIFLPNKS